MSERLPDPAIAYPRSQRSELVESQFGHRIADPYRWLEADSRHDPEVAGWVEKQNALSRHYLDGLAERPVFERQLAELFDYEECGVPMKRGNLYFHTLRSGLRNQPLLQVRDGVDGPSRLLLDPNTWSADGADSMAEWDASDDGAYVAYGIQRAGTDWRDIRVLEVATGRTLDDVVSWARFGIVSWAKDGSGFFYSRYPEPEGGMTSHAGVTDHAVYFHRLGTDQSSDRLIHATPDMPYLLHIAGVTDDGRYLIVMSTLGASMTMVSIADLTTDDWTVRPVAGVQFDAEWSAIGNIGTTLFMLTSKDAPRRKIVTVDVSDPRANPTPLIGENDAAIEHVVIVGEHIVVAYLVDAKTELRRFTLDGRPDGAIELPGIGSAGVRGISTDDEAFIAFTSFNAPLTIYRYEVASGDRTIWAAPQVKHDLSNIAVEQRFFSSKDGTRVPMFIVRRADAEAPAPTLLYGYGGYGISLTPYYSQAQLAWVARGGTLAVANIRGGGEYGRSWHDDGRLLKKQNSYDDFIAAAEFLLSEGIAGNGQIAIQGEFNGGLLVGAVTNQRPDLFSVALPGVGVMDLLRFHHFTGGAFWASDYGDPTEETAFNNLLTLSPCHNIAAGTPYPAMLVMTADTDDRVVPGHSYKYTAALQSAELGAKPRLLRVETRAGHGGGKPLDKVIAETADMWAFAAHWTGLRP